MKLFENSNRTRKPLTEANNPDKVKKDYKALVDSMERINSLKSKKMSEVIESEGSELKKLEALKISLAQDLMNITDDKDGIRSEILLKISRNDDRILWRLNDEAEQLARIASEHKRSYLKISKEMEALLKSTRD